MFYLHLVYFVVKTLSFNMLERPSAVMGNGPVLFHWPGMDGGR
jgi:hypothetical protein